MPSKAVPFPRRFKRLKSAVKKPDAIFAVDQELKKKVWVKGALTSESKIKREFEVLNSIDSPYVVCAYDYIVDGLHHYVVIENAAGQPVSRLLRRRMTQRARLLVAEQVIEGFAAVERAGVLYRDFLDAHVYVDSRTRPVSVKLIDFNNVFRDVRPDGCFENYHAQGPYMTMAPEEFSVGTRLSGSANVYSLACLVYKLFAGHYPVDELIAGGVSPQNIVASPEYRRLDDTIRGGTLFPPRVFRALKRALAYDPRRRWQSVAEFADALLTRRARPTVPPPPEVSWIVPGRLGVSSRPGFAPCRMFRKSSAQEVAAAYAALQASGFVHCVSLLTGRERNRYYRDADVGGIARAHFTTFTEMPLDSHPAVDPLLREVIAASALRTRNEEPVLIHCNGGVGRACTVAACILAKMALDAGNIPPRADKLIADVRAARGSPRAIENATQEALIRTYVAELATAGLTPPPHDGRGHSANKRPSGPRRGVTRPTRQRPT